MKVLKITQILTLGANIYMTKLRFSRAGVVCSCDVYPLPDDQVLAAMIEKDACFGPYTSMVEYIMWTLWAIFIIIGGGILVFFCTDFCARYKDRLENANHVTDNDTNYMTSSIQETEEDSDQPLLTNETGRDSDLSAASNSIAQT